MAERFVDRLAERSTTFGALCVGIDPSSEVLREWGRDDNAAGAEYAALELVEVSAGAAAAVKPQVAYFERFGSRGFAALERVIRDAHDAGLLVVADAKRGDVSSTNEGYAAAWLSDASPLCVDAVTVNPYLGVSSLAPFVTRARASGRAIFVLAATSNPEGREIQEARRDDELVEDYVLRRVAELNAAGDGAVGVVVGATRESPRFSLSALGGPILVPGLGAQGASAADVARLTRGCAPGTVLANVARDLVRGAPERRQIQDRARRWRDDLLAAL